MSGHFVMIEVLKRGDVLGWVLFMLSDGCRGEENRIGAGPAMERDRAAPRKWDYVGCDWLEGSGGNVTQIQRSREFGKERRKKRDD